MKKQLLTLLLCLLGCAVGYAQSLITGTVVDDSGEPLVGVNVLIKGTSTGTMTDFDGKFSLSATAKDVLVFSYLGFKSEEVQANTKRPMSVALHEDKQALDEVVVIGYQDVRKRDLTGSVAKANMEDMLKAAVPSFDQALAGRVAGVNVSSAEGMPGGEMNIVIRGNNSVTQDNSPLYVVDGFPVEDASIASAINPNDIESLDILKDASATAIYGSRGANGVVIITTKKGSVGAPQVSYDGSFGIQHISRTIPMMNAYEFVKLQSEIYTTAEIQSKSSYFPLKSDLMNEYGSIPNTYFASLLEGKSDDYRVTLDDYIGADQYNWQDLIFRDAWQQNHSVSLTGGTAEARYNASVSYFGQDGIVKYSNYNRFQGRLGLNVKKNHLTINLKANYSCATTNGSSPSQSQYSGMNNLFYSVWGYRPTTQPSTPLSNLLNSDTDDNVNANNDYRFNPIKSLQNEYRMGRTHNAQFNGFLEYEFIKGLKLRATGGYTIYNKKNETFNNSSTRYGMPTSTNKVNATYGDYERHTWLNEDYLTYQTQIKKAHNLSVMAGVSLQGSKYKYYSMMTTQIPYESLGMAGMQDGTPNTITSGETDWTMFSYYGRFSYDYKSRYYLTATFRADGSSKMAKGHKFGYFPSVSAAWSLSEEPWMKVAQPWLSHSKIRFSWGQTGNNRVGEYDSYAKLAQLKALSSGIYSGVYGTNNTISTGVVPVSLANENLKWETTTQMDAGLDLGFFSDRLEFVIDWYRKITDDLLLAADMAPSSGYPTATKNIGSVQNMGWEFTINAKPVKTRHFLWDMSFNIAFNRNKVLALTENQLAMLTNARFDQNYTSANYIAKVGYPIGMMYGYVYEGTYKYEDFDGGEGSYTLKEGIPHFSSENSTQPGYPRYADLNGDGVIDSNDQTIIGRGEPKHTGGFTNNFTFYGVDISVFFQWSYGNDILNANKLFFETGTKNKDLNMYATYANRWTPENPTSDIPVVSNSSSNKVFSSRLIEDGSYLRLKTISIGYTFDQKLTKKAHISKARIYFSAQNVWTWTRYTGYDPEVSIKTSALTPGLDFSSYPRAMSFNFGLNLTF